MLSDFANADAYSDTDADADAVTPSSNTRSYSYTRFGIPSSIGHYLFYVSSHGLINDHCLHR